MPWHMEYVSDKATVMVNGGGRLCLQDMTEMAGTVARLLDENKARRVLLDCSEADLDVAIVDIFYLPEYYTRVGVPRSTRIALVLPKARWRSGSYDFFETVCRNKGYICKLFDSQSSAEWWLGVPVEMRVEVGAWKTDMQLASLNLTGLDVSLGAGETTIDLSGDWTHDLDVTIEAGAGDITVRVPSQVGVRAKVQAGIGSIVAPGFSKDGDIYTNATFGDSDVTLNIDIEAGIGQITLEVAESSSLTKGFNLGLVAN